MSKRLLSMGFGKDLLTTLTRNGYQTQQDITSRFDTAESLATELKLSLDDAQSVLSRCKASSISTPGFTMLQMTQSAAQMVHKSQKVSTGCTPLDELLDGGLVTGSILELSGPPGSPKHVLAMNIVASFVESGDEVVFIECQNNTSPSSLSRFLEGNGKELSNLVHFSKISVLVDLLLFLHQLPTFLQSNSKVSLLVVNSISSPFQNAELTISQRTQTFERFKQSFLKICSAHNLTVVLTSQLATKMINADGTPGTFESGAKGVMLPQLGPAYLPSGKSYRVILATTGLGTGVMKLLSSPKYPPGKVPSISAPYKVIDGVIGSVG
ncbi:hypothetical protein D9613_009767 [Agrocybe pediades]|uniref:DNA repair protein RAD51 homolog 3 n=1 Tax=Agrocybe pediades TaxID=84607 RepID=A0A8H4QXW5_9AGAR|nr:hypothetical protein D9613_009767 [Agrocybe pediades]